MKNKKGFTLIELLATISILGVLMLIGVISYNSVTAKAKLNAALSSAKNYIAGIEYKNMTEDENDKITYMMTNNKELDDVLESGDYPDDGVVVMYNNKVGQAKLCYDDSISIEYFLGKYTLHDSNIYCNYIDNAILGETGNDINQNLLTEETKIAGLRYYREPEEDILIDPVTNKGLGYVSTKTPLNITELNDIKEKFSDGVIRTNSVAKDNSVTKMAPFPSRYDLNEKGYVTSVKDQGGTPSCWAHAGVGSAESRLLVREKFSEGNLNATEKEFSPRQVDYFSFYEGIKGLKNNPYYKLAYVDYHASEISNANMKYRNIDSGGDYEVFAKTLFNTLSLQYASDFNDSELNELYTEYKSLPLIFAINGHTEDELKKSPEEIFAPKKVEYFVDSARLFYFEDVDRNDAISKMKQLIYNSNATIAVSYCSNAGIVLPTVKYNGQSTKLININSLPSGSLCGKHAGLVVGWDDNVAGGSWIVKNSWGDINPYLYISYNYNPIYENEMFSVYSVNKKYWDNSYDSYNNTEVIYSKDELCANLVCTEKVPARMGNVFYYDKINGKKEEIVGIGYYKGSLLEKNPTSYVFEVENKEQCESIVHSVNATQINTENFDYNKLVNYGAVEIEPPFNLETGYEFVPYSPSRTFGKIDNVFENDICIISNFSNNYEESITVLTDDIEDKNSPVEKVAFQNKLISKKDKEYSFNTVVTGLPSGTKIDFLVYDENKKNITSQLNIQDNIVINNVAHPVLNLREGKKYKINTSVEVNGIKYSQGFEVGESTFKTDSKRPHCNWGGTPSKFIAGATPTVKLNCTDESGILTGSLTLDDIGSSSWFVNPIEISEPEISNNGTRVTWKIKFKVGKSINHKAHLVLRDDAVYDSYYNVSKKAVTGDIPYQRKG